MWIVAGFTMEDWTAEADQTAAEFGRYISTAGDVNGDGNWDVVVGAFMYDGGESNEGRAYVYHGSAGGLGAAPAWTAESNQSGSNFGSSVSGGGDVNGDGFGDIIVGAPYWGVDGAGATYEGGAYVFHGSATGLDPDPSWIATGDQTYAYLGAACAFIGDVNGDGYDDVSVAATAYDNGERDEGRLYAYYGSAIGLPSHSDWSDEPNDVERFFGQAVAGAGDVDGDGFDDMIIGDPFYAQGAGSLKEGRAGIYYGSATGLGTQGWSVASDVFEAQMGHWVSSAGDVHADGFADVIVGSPYDRNGQDDEGAAYVYYGSSSGPASVADWTVESNENDANLGFGVSSAGDVNNDCYDDVVVGLPNADAGSFNEGTALVYLGTSTGLSAASFLLESDQTYASFGIAVAGAGDVDGDGFDDVLVGASMFDNGETDEGRTYLFAGTYADSLDSDSDGVYDGCDVCPLTFDPMQEDEDADGIGDACDQCPASSPDADADGFCAAQDCDDDDPTVYPGAEELCDGLDNACAGSVSAVELDDDGDGVRLCDGDCDDSDLELFPGQAETCNGLDDDCDGQLGADEIDADDDHVTVCDGDCNDLSARRSPELTDICGDGIDNDCDGEVDQTCAEDTGGCACNTTSAGAGGPLFALAALLRITRRRRAPIPPP